MSLTFGNTCRAALIALSAFVSALIPDTTNAATSEYAVKAAYLYKFTAYVEWPNEAFATSDNALVIGVIGADALADSLEKITTGQNVNGRPVLVRKLTPGDPLAGIHVLFVGELDNPPLLETLVEATNKSVLTVSESEKAYALGSMINFVIAGGKVRFEVALDPVETGRLKISARMLSAAWRVARSTP